jgi:uncharacterized protein YndB with AHSA1/START domain
MSQSFSIVREVHIDAPRLAVFALLTELDQLQKWMPMASFDARAGGRYEYVVGEWIAEGEIVEIDPPSRLVYTWDWRNEPMGVATTVEFVLADEGAGTLVTMRHFGLPVHDLVDSHARGWDHVLPRLAIVATGGDPGPANVLAAVFGEQ